MTRYDYECGLCGSVRELSFSIAEKPETVACDCGGSASSVISGGQMAVVLGRPWECSKPVFPGRWENGVTAEQRQLEIKANHALLKAQAMESKARGTDRNVRHIASIPAEEYAARATESPGYWEENLVEKCKKDGYHFGND